MNKIQIIKTLIFQNKFTFKKIKNLIMSYCDYLTKNTYTKRYPSILMVEPTNVCNLRCRLCPTGNGSLKTPKGFMAIENYRKVIDELGDYLLNVTFWNYGEPFMHKDVYQMLNIARDKKIYTRVSTNGHFFKDDNTIPKLLDADINELIISVDGASQETYIEYRGLGDFSLVIENLRKIVNMKKQRRLKNPYIELQFIIMRHNMHEVEKIKSIARKLGVDKLKLKHVSFDLDEKQNKEELMKIYLPYDERYSKYKMRADRLIRKKNIKNKCIRLWISSVVNWDGAVTPCCYDAHRRFDFGNCFRDNFIDVWTNAKYVSLRDRILKHKQNINLCKGCPGEIFGQEI